MFDSKLWEHAGPDMFIGVYQNEDFKHDRAVTLSVSEYSIESLLNQDLLKRYEIYNSIYNEIKQVPYDMAIEDRAKVTVEGGNGMEFTYGECEYLHLLPLLNLVKPKAGDVFYDLGCGTAKPIAVAAFEYP